MIIIQERAEESLVQALKSSKASGWEPRCLYIDGASGALLQKANVPQLAAAHIHDEQAQAFVCEDGDVFIIASDIQIRDAAALRKDILSAAKDVIASEKDFLQVLDVRAQWYSITEIVEAKVERSRLRDRVLQEEMERLQKEAARRSVLDISFDDAVVRSIPQRRKAREKKSSLVVEDDFFTRTLVGSIVGRQIGFVPASSGEEAIRHYVIEAPDIVFLDIGLPDVNGHEVLQKLLKIDPQAYIVMLSGGGSRENIMQAMAAGAKGFIVKPFTQEKIKQYIDKCSTVS